MQRLLGTASAPSLPRLVPLHGPPGGTPAVPRRDSLVTPPRKFKDTQARADAEWDAAAQERRRAGAKPRKRRERKLPPVEVARSRSGKDPSDPALDLDDGASDAESLGRRRSSSLSSLFAWMRGGERLKKGHPCVEMSMQASEEDRSPDRLPDVANGFDTLGEFVHFHRERQAASSSPSSCSSGLPPLPGASGSSPTSDRGGTLAHAASPADVAAQLHEAVRCQDLRKVKHLLGCGVAFPVDAVNADGETAAVCAAHAGSAEIVAALLDAGADPLARDSHPEFFGDGVWPDERRPTVCKAKRPAGALSGKTVVYHLRLAGCFDEVLKRIFPMTRVKLVRAISSAIQTFHNNSAIIFAMQQGYARLAALLLDHSMVHGSSRPAESRGAAQAPFWSEATRTGSTGVRERAGALLVACTHRQWRCAEVVLGAGVPAPSLDITRDPSGRTALHLAAAAGQRQTIQLLVRARASLTIFSGYGRQPLHDACAAGHLSAARVLVEGGADPRVPVRAGNEGIPWKSCDVGKTALELAETRGYKELSSFLSTCVRRPDLPASSDGRAP